MNDDEDLGGSTGPESVRSARAETAGSSSRIEEDNENPSDGDGDGDGDGEGSEPALSESADASDRRDGVSAGGRDVAAEQSFEVVATLVEDEAEVQLEGTAYAHSASHDGRGGDGDRAPVAVAVAEATKLWCGLNFSDRRVRLAVCFVFASLVALAVGLVAALGRGGEGGERVGSVSDSSQGQSVYSTSVPASPTLAPTPSPTSLSWEAVGPTIIGAGELGQFGTLVSASVDGAVVAASYWSSPTYFSLRRRLAVSYDATAAVLLEETTANPPEKEDGFVVEREYRVLVELVPDCLYWDRVGVALAGHGKVAALVYAGCGLLGVDIWAPIVSSSDSIAAVSPSSTSPSPANRKLQQTNNSSTSSPSWMSVMVYSAESLPDYDRLIPTPEAALSEDGSVLAIGYDGNMTVYSIASSDPDTILPPFGVSLLSKPVEGGTSISLSADGSTIASVVDQPFLYEVINGTETDNMIPSAYAVLQVWRFNAGRDGLIQVGSDLGRSAFVHSTSISEDGSIVAVGGSDRDEVLQSSPYPDPGRVRVYRYDEKLGDWRPIGQVLRGDNDGDSFGRSVSLSRDGRVLAVGASGVDAAGLGSGLTVIFRYDDDRDEFIRLGDGDIPGREGGEAFGSTVSVSGNGQKVVVGAPFSRIGGNDCGRVAVYELSGVK